MGVQNLWVLLAPVGRQIEIESLAHKVLAVDASIWLTQFVKAMRDDEGQMIKNAHLIGTFHRVAKLLFFGIKPVFVFDGDTPAIKKKTTAARRRRQEHQAANLKQTAQRILINRLKLQREQMKRNGGKAEAAVAANFVLPAAQDKRTGSTGDTESKASSGGTPPLSGAAASAIEIGSSSDNEGREELQTASVKSADGHNQQQQQKEMLSDGDGDDLTIDDIVLDTSRIDKIDLQAVFALPAHLQKDMINRIMSDRRQEVRNQFIPLAGKPEAYSHTQISSFLATTALHRRIEAAKKKNREKQTEALGVGSPQGAKLGPGKRIASSSNRFFVYKKASEGGNNSDEEEKVPAGLPTLSDSDDEQGALGNGMSVVGDIERFADEAKRSSVFTGAAADGDAHGGSLPLLIQFKKRRHRDEDDLEIGKRALTDFDVGSVKEFAAQAERQQRRKWAVQVATTAWIAKSETQAKTEPTLAIEQARRKRLKIEDPKAEKGADQKADEAAKNICITIKTGEVETVDDKFLELFPASIFAGEQVDAAGHAVSVKGVKTVDNADEEDDDDVEWENASATTAAKIVVEKPSEQTKSRTPPPISAAGDLEPIAAVDLTGTDDEDDVEWEEVDQADQQEKELSKRDHKSPAPEESKSDGEAGLLPDAANPELTDEDEENRDDNDDMYLSLKSELEDAKAEEDLEELRGEALKSALATASNLTQWAAGAVRRALAAHSLQHKQFVDSTHPFTGKASPSRGYRVSKDEVIEVADDEEEETKSDHSVAADHKETSSIELDQQEKSEQATISMGLNGEEMSEDAQLQIAIANSIAEDLDKPRVSRYLQYAPSAKLAAASPPPQSTALEAIVDVSAIQSEQIELKKLRNRQMRDVEGFNDDMVEDVMELLRLFGVPYLVCPMEAEAQCAALEQLGLVDGIITDDSDIFPFGGRKVYKNIFHNQKFVEAFFAKDIEQELGFSQEEMISLALLLGSDYTDGIRGIGIVNATEVVNAYPGIDGLQEFKQWVQAFDLTEEAQRVVDRKAKKSDAEIAEMDVRERFKHTHASVRRKWELGEEFPNAQVVKAYKQPQVDRSDARFSWSLPDLAALREYTGRTFGWDQQKADSVLLPLLEKAASSNKGVQTRIDQFFTTYDDQVRYAKIQSKRLRSAVESRASNSKAPAAANVPSVKPNTTASAKSKAKSTPTKKKKITKKKTTLSALGFAPKK